MTDKPRDVDSLKQFCSDLHSHGLMDEDTMRSVWKSIETKKPRDAEELSKELIRRKYITPYQFEQIKKNETKHLKIGQYTVVDRIGAGGMGEVLKARHTKMHRDVAVKIISEKVLDSPDALERFEQESRTAAQLSHPNIVAAYDAGESDGMHYLVMEYVDGQDLHSIIGRNGPLRLPLALDYMIQVAEGLQYAHRKNVVHRDIKPANLLVDSTGVVKILDMGLAFMAQREASEETSNQRLTQHGQIMGTSAYMAPEQAVDVRKADARSDIYSLGCTLYDVLVGRPPYDGETNMAVIVAHREEPIPSIRAERSDCPAQVDQVFRRMVAKNPEDRYASMNEVIEALRACPTGQAEKPPVADSTGSAATTSLPPIASSPSKPPVASNTEVAIAVEPAPLRPADDTATFVAARRDTVVSRSKSKPRQPSMAIMIGAAVLSVLALGGGALAVVLSLSTPTGTLVVETNDDDIKVAVKQGGEFVEIVDANDDWTINLKEGTYELELTGGKDQFKLDQNSVVVKRGKTERLRVTFEPAVAMPVLPEANPIVPQPNTRNDSPTSDQPAGNRPPQVAARRDGQPLRPAGVKPPRGNVVKDAVPNLKEVHQLDGVGDDWLSGLGFTPDGKQVVASCRTALRFWDVESGKLVNELNHGIERGDFAISPDGKTVAVVGDYMEGGIYRIDDGQKIHDLTQMERKVAEEHVRVDQRMPLLSGVAFSPDGGKVVFGDSKARVIIVNAKTGEEITRKSEHAAMIYGIRFAPNGKHFGTVSYDGTSRIWNGETNELLHTLRNGSESTTFDLVFSGDSKTLYTVGNSTKITAWDVASGEMKREWAGHGSPVISVSLSSDEKMLATTGSGDSSLRFWDVAKGETKSVWRNATEEHQYVRFSPTDPTLFVASTRGPSIQLWRYNGEAQDERESVFTADDGSVVVRQEVADDHLVAPPWQSFTAPVDGKLFRVEFQPLMQEGSQATLSVYVGDGTLGKVIATQKVNILATGDGDWRVFDLTQHAELEKGRVYTVELDGAEGMMHSTQDRYAGGNGSRDWATDMAFRFHIDPTE